MIFQLKQCKPRFSKPDINTHLSELECRWCRQASRAVGKESAASRALERREQSSPPWSVRRPRPVRTRCPTPSRWSRFPCPVERQSFEKNISSSTSLWGILPRTNSDGSDNDKVKVLSFQLPKSSLRPVLLEPPLVRRQFTLLVSDVIAVNLPHKAVLTRTKSTRKPNSKPNFSPEAQRGPRALSGPKVISISLFLVRDCRLPSRSALQDTLCTWTGD